MGADAAVSGSTLAVTSSARSVACDGAEKHTNNAVATINAERPLALIFISVISPFRWSRKAGMNPMACL
jgi:hypothetical protein